MIRKDTIIKRANYEKKSINFIYLLFSIGFIITMGSYFTWSTYSNGVFNIPLRIFSYSILPILFFYEAFYKKNINITLDRMIIIFLSFLLCISLTFFSIRDESQKPTSLWIAVLYIMVLLFISDYAKYEIFNLLIIMFIICSLPSVIYIILSLVGIDIPHTLLQSNQQLKVAGGTIYNKYFMGLIITNVYGVGIRRPCGLFDEPGVLGTFSILFYSCLIDEAEKKIQKILLLIIAFFSFSLAAILLLCIVYVVYFYKKSLTKYFWLFLLIPILYLIFINIDFNNSFISTMQQRLMFNETGLVGNNRVTSTFDEQLKQFLENGGIPLLFGYGQGGYTKNIYMTGSSSYKCLLYDYGIIGTSILFIILILIYKSESKNDMSLVFMICFVASIYQRPYVFNITYMIVFICGFAYTNYIHKQQKECIESIRL